MLYTSSLNVHVQLYLEIWLSVSTLFSKLLQETKRFLSTQFRFYSTFSMKQIFKIKATTALLTCWRSSVKISVFSALVKEKIIFNTCDILSTTYNVRKKFSELRQNVIAASIIYKLRSKAWLPFSMLCVDEGLLFITFQPSDRPAASRDKTVSSLSNGWLLFGPNLLKRLQRRVSGTLSLRLFTKFPPYWYLQTGRTHVWVSGVHFINYRETGGVLEGILEGIK